MKKTFLVKKDPLLPGNDDNWIIMNSFEFVQFLETEEGQLRKNYFVKLDPVSEEDSILYMECDQEKVQEIKQEQNHKEYLRKCEAESGYETISYDDPLDMCDEGDITTILDLIIDETMDTEEMAIKETIRKELPAALAKLSKPERDLILALYTGEENMTEYKYSKKSGLCRKTVRKRHQNALRKLRLHFRIKRLL